MVAQNGTIFGMKFPRFLVALYVVVAIAAGMVASSNYKSLEQHVPYDYPFYMQFYAKIYSSTLAHDLAPYTGQCMRGHNAFFYGCDGTGGIHRGLHFDPLKYVLALVYSAFKSPIALSVVYILFFYSPLLYAAWLIRKRLVGDARLLTVAMTVYSVFPGALVVVNDALRLMTFFFPFFTLLFLAILYRRSALEQFLFLNLLLITREEAIVIALVPIAFMVLREYLEGVGDLRQKLRGFARGRSIKLLINTLLWIVPTAIYLRWISASYAVTGGDLDSARLGHTARRFMAWIHAHAGLSGLLGLALAIAVIWCVVRYHRTALRLLATSPIARAISVVGIVAGAIIALLFLGWTPFPWTELFFFTRIGLLVAILGLLVLLAVMETFSKDRPIERAVWSYALVAVVVISLGVQLFGDSSIFRTYARNQEKSSDAALVFVARKSIDPVADVVIGDEKTSRALYDVNRAITYNGLPAGLTATSSTAFARTLFANPYGSKTYVLVEKRDVAPLVALAKQAAVKLRPLLENASYSFILCER